MGNQFRILRSDKISIRWGVIGAGLYFSMYLFSIGAFRAPGRTTWAFQTAGEGLSMLFRTSAPFLWEPMVRISTPVMSLVLAPMNVVLGLLLSSLVFMNVATAINLYRQPKSCRVDGGTKGLLAIFPSFLSGFVCCVPTFLIPLASLSASLTVYVIWLRVFLIPLSLLLLAWGAWYGLRRVRVV